MTAWWQKRISLKHQAIGVSLQAGSYAVARVSLLPKRPKLEDFLTGIDGQKSAAIVDLLRQKAWRKLPIYSLLAIDDYSVVQLARPDVQENELAAAVRWALLDLVDIPVAELSFDIFARPSSGRGAGATQLNVAVCRKTTIQQQSNLFMPLNELQAIGIRELALGNLLQRVPEAADGLACLLRLPDGLFLLIMKDDNLYLFRGLMSIDWEHVRQALLAGDVEPADGLLLELQRSLDFYEHQLAMTPISCLGLAPVESDDRLIMDYLSLHLDHPCVAIPLASLIDLPRPLEFAEEQALLATIGAVLPEGH